MHTHTYLKCVYDHTFIFHAIHFVFKFNPLFFWLVYFLLDISLFRKTCDFFCSLFARSLANSLSHTIFSFLVSRAFFFLLSLLEPYNHAHTNPHKYNLFFSSSFSFSVALVLVSLLLIRHGCLLFPLPIVSALWIVALLHRI